MAVSEEDILYLSAQLEARLGDIQRENTMLIDKLNDYKSAQRDAARVNKQLYRRIMQLSSQKGSDFHRNGGAIDKRSPKIRSTGGGRGRQKSSTPNILRRARAGNSQQRASTSVPMDGDDIDFEDLIAAHTTGAVRPHPQIQQQLMNPQRIQPQPPQQIIVMQRNQSGTMRQATGPIRVGQTKVEPQIPPHFVLTSHKMEPPTQQRNTIVTPKIELKIDDEGEDSPPELPVQETNVTHHQRVQSKPKVQDSKPIVRTVTPSSKPPSTSSQSSTPQVTIQGAQSTCNVQTSQSPPQTSKQRLETAFKAFAKRTGPIIQQEFVAAGNTNLNQRTLALELVSRWQKLPDDERKSYFASL